MSFSVFNRIPRGRETPARFEDRVALIAGVSDHGVGGAVAERIAGEGGKLILLDKQEPRRLLRRLKGKTDVSWHKVDITIPAVVESAVQRAVAQFRRIDLIVNGAGVCEVAELEDLGEDVWDRSLDVNLKGAVRVIRAALPHFPQIGGAIVNVASVMGLAGCRGYSLYSATKAAMIGMTQSLAVELAPRSIRVCCVAPSLMLTPLTMSYSGAYDGDMRERLKACLPLGLGSPHDVAAAVAFLGSHEARWITGVTLPLGWTSQLPFPVEAHLLKKDRDEYIRAAA